MSILDNWEQWKDFLGDRLESAQEQGMSQSAISDVAVQVGDYLAKQVDPKILKKEFFQIYGLLLLLMNNKRLQIL